jgi:hypothetical protein
MRLYNLSQSLLFSSLASSSADSINDNSGTELHGAGLTRVRDDLLKCMLSPVIGCLTSLEFTLRSACRKDRQADFGVPKADEANLPSRHNAISPLKRSRNGVNRTAVPRTLKLIVDLGDKTGSTK